MSSEMINSFGEDVGGELGWNDQIEKDSEFILLPEGDYVFEVLAYERQRHNGSEKLTPCNIANMHLKVFGADGKLITLADGNPLIIKHRLFLHTKMEGLLSAFFCGVGLKKHGEPLKMNFDASVGTKGRAKIGIKEYNGRQYNEIKKFYDYDPEKMRPAAAPAPTAFNPGKF